MAVMDLDWEPAVTTLAQQRGPVLFVGGSDCGKSTLIQFVANAALTVGRRVAVVDADLDSGEFGPPGALSLGRVEAPLGALAEVKPRRTEFVGSRQATSQLLDVTRATLRLVHHARHHGDELILIDTPPSVHGRLAERLQLALIQLVEPTLVVFLVRGEETDRLQQLAEGASRAPLLRVPTPSQLRPKSEVYRRIQRAARVRRHFQNGRAHEISLGMAQLVNTWLYTGRSLGARPIQQATEVLGVSVLHAETTPEGVAFCVTGEVMPGRVEQLQEEYPHQRILLTQSSYLRHLLLGLVGEGGLPLDVALLQGINFQRAVISVLTPSHLVASVRQVHFGRLQLRPDGTELGVLRPGDL